MWIEIGLAIGIPALGFMVAYARYAWKKSQCFIALQNKVKNMQDHSERLDEIEENQQKWIIYLKLLLDDRKISYK
jgi:hypothetical protein